MEISIIIPAYNAEPYIRRCLDSVLQTRLEKYEIIVVDDGSSDCTLEILKSYREQYSCVSVITQPNSGAAAARNKGLDLANGEYVGFVDADDWVEPTMFSEMYGTARKYDADIVFCNVYRNDSEKMRKYVPTGLYERDRIESAIFPLLVSNIDETNGKTVLRGSVCPRIFRKTLLMQQRVRFDEQLVYNEDGLFSIQATLHANRYYYLGDSYLYHNRYVHGSVTRRYIDNLWDRQKDVGEKLLRMTKDSKYDFSAQITKKNFEVAIYCLENIYKESSPLNWIDKRRETNKILQDPVVRKSVRKICPNKLKRINKGYYYAIRYGLPDIIPLICWHRRKKNARRHG